MEPIIKIENLSKQYRLGTIGTGTIKNDIKRWWHKARGKDDPFLKISETNDRAVKGISEYVWALKDINLDIMPGEVMGIIGKNGAGKSTLLKILSKVTGPTTGKIHFNGRIGSLLEVGTGFHPELTGKENIFLNGAILGMTKPEIRRKLDEIIDFSGCGRYIDTPVKRYSSGMLVRLGFAVAAHLEPEILVVDEVLAVGDAEFHKKAIGKMQDVSKGEGRTVLFVSHNMTAVRQLCDNGVIIQNGSIHARGKISEVIDKYLENEFNYFKHQYQNTSTIFNKAILRHAKIISDGALKVNSKIVVEFVFEVESDMETNLSLVLNDNYENVIFNSISNVIKAHKGTYNCRFEIYENLLNDGFYSIDIYIVDYQRKQPVFIEKKVLGFEVADYRETEWIGKWTGAVRPKLKFEIFE
ncbi:MAG: ATP-binding cassette domain-containing protein [Bacteroidales bacterium]|nr:ATP-binding cassette domain-containing protein [Bacteroidales bacterium]